METSLPFQIALTLIPQLGPVKGKKLLEQLEPPEIFNCPAKDLEKIEGIGTLLANNIAQFDQWKRVEEELTFIERNQIKPLFIGQQEYPHRLLHCNDAPLLLYVKGSAHLNAKRMIAVVGTRRNTLAGRLATEKLIEALSPYNISIVSGMAYGIDTIAHQAALREKIPTIGALAHGLDRIYPPANRSLAKQIIQQGGALLTENRKGVQAEEFLFPKRNRIVAGMTDATIVMESDLKGGSLITAQLAADYGREVFALPGRITDKCSSGCLAIIKKQRALLFTSAEDITDWLGWTIETDRTIMRDEKSKEIAENLSAEEKFLHRIIQKNETANFESLLQETSWPVTKLSGILLNMELAGLIVSLPGNCYSVI